MEITDRPKPRKGIPMHSLYGSGEVLPPGAQSYVNVILE